MGDGLLLPQRILFGSLDVLVPFARLRASAWLYNGKVTPINQARIATCRHFVRVAPDLVACVIYTRDVGHHSSGWWKNPDYERCMHLSLSFSAYPSPQQLPHDRRASEAIARAFFGEHARLAWIEGPYSAEGKAKDVWHYRVFCDPAWAPLLPKGEVYSKADTPAGWRSFSEIHGYRPEPADAPLLLDAGQPDA